MPSDCQRVLQVLDLQLYNEEVVVSTQSFTFNLVTIHYLGLIIQSRQFVILHFFTLRFYETISLKISPHIFDICAFVTSRASFESTDIGFQNSASSQPSQALLECIRCCARILYLKPEGLANITAAPVYSRSPVVLYSWSDPYNALNYHFACWEGL